MTESSVYKDKSLEVGKVLSQSTDAEIGIPSRGALQSTDQVWVRRTAGGATSTGYTDLVTLGLSTSVALPVTVANGGTGSATAGANALTNYEVLAGNKTLSIGSPRNQFLSPGGATRNVTLDATCNVAGTTFYIANTVVNGDAIVLKDSAAATIDTLTYLCSIRVTYTGSAWSIIDAPDTFRIPSSTYINGNSAGFAYIAAGGTVKVSVTSTGTGIAAGISAPSYLLHVSATGNSSALLVDDTTGSIGTGIAPSASYQLSVTPSAAGSIIVYAQAADKWPLTVVHGSGVAVDGLGVDSSQRIFLMLKKASDATADVLIRAELYSHILNNLVVGSTTDATGRLQVTGSTSIASLIDSSATGNPKLSFYQTATEKAFIQYVNATGLLLDSDVAVDVAPNNTFSTRYQTNGDVSIGTITQYTGKLQVTGTADLISAIDASATGDPKIALYQQAVQRGFLQYVNTGGILRLDGAGPIAMAPANTTAGTWQASGNLTIGATADTNPFMLLALTSTTKLLGLTSLTAGQVTTLGTALTGGGYTQPGILHNATTNKLIFWNGTEFETITSL